MTKCDECGSMIPGEHRPDCRAGAAEELAALRLFFASMQTMADPTAGRYHGSQVGQAFRTAATAARLVRGGDGTAYHPAAHTFTVHGARAWHAGSAALALGGSR